jgi:hypothetical protein
VADRPVPPVEVQRPDDLPTPSPTEPASSRSTTPAAATGREQSSGGS